MTGLRLEGTEFGLVRELVTVMNARREALHQDGVTGFTFDEEAQMIHVTTFFGPTTMTAREFLARFQDGVASAMTDACE